MENNLKVIGSFLFGLRFFMSFFYIGLIFVLLFILTVFSIEIWHLIVSYFHVEIKKMDLIIKVLELVDITMVAQLVWVVALAGFSLFVTSGHFEDNKISKPDWLDHVAEPRYSNNSSGTSFVCYFCSRHCFLRIFNKKRLTQALTKARWSRHV